MFIAVEQPLSNLATGNELIGISCCFYLFIHQTESEKDPVNKNQKGVMD
jgi:hypothetical protein